ncbi:hypothetical protein HHL22_19855 [Hymenobacter sp. RP-2-7]|uniref:Uncharacterized protein n=1 Tax=Hymenobacter polaris TaxID=2682546 RepID=A0A7Y0AHH5_9BACT|nr:hypothetical protein [Hymenobacter polaris]NML67463.1 hypothetical protein [Hymenobacter polaris]
MLNGLLLALLFAFLLPLTGRGQATPTKSVASPDSIAAVKRLFRQRRQGSSLGLAVGCGTVAPGATAMSTPPEPSQMLLPPTAVAGLGTNCSLLCLFSRLRFSSKREQQVLQLLARHQPLPGYVQRALSPVLASN